jgi:hypothetical protein
MPLNYGLVKVVVDGGGVVVSSPKATLPLSTSSLEITSAHLFFDAQGNHPMVLGNIESFGMITSCSCHHIRTHTHDVCGLLLHKWVILMEST